MLGGYLSCLTFFCEKKVTKKRPAASASLKVSAVARPVLSEPANAGFKVYFGSVQC